MFINCINFCTLRKRRKECQPSEKNILQEKQGEPRSAQIEYAILRLVSHYRIDNESLIIELKQPVRRLSAKIFHRWKKCCRTGTKCRMAECLRPPHFDSSV